jgi:WD40 repeat protein
LAEIFISHASADNLCAGRAAEALRLAGHGVFLDSDRAEGIVPGAAWQRTLLRELRICDAVVFLNSRAAQASMWCHSELVVASDLRKRLYSLDLGPDLLPHPLLESVQGIVFDSCMDDSLRRLTDSLESSGLAIRTRLRWERDRPPYPGLVAMDVADSGVFFGREDEIRDLVARVDRPLGSRDSDLVVVMGPSGAGKSSLVRAGLAARLGVPRSGWAVVSPFEPGIGPLDRLVIRMTALAPGQLDEKACRARLSSEGLAAFGEWLAEHTPVPARRLLIVVDQAEQLISVTPAREREAFLTTLAGGLRQGSPVTVVLTVRSDRFDEIQRLPQIEPAIQAPFLTSPMSRSRLATVIEGPAQRADLTFEAGLVSRLADDAARGSGGEDGDALPFLAFVLREMYDRVVREDRTTFTHADYEQAGRIDGAIVRRTEAAEAALPSDSGPVLDRMLTRFVAVDEEHHVAARPVQRALLTDAEQAVAGLLVDQRLLIGTADTVRLVHDSLLVAWPRLAAAVAERRDDLVLQARLERQAGDWTSGHGALLDRVGTADASSWLAREAGPGANEAVREYIRKSARGLRRRRASVISIMSVIVVLALAASATAVVAVIQRSVAVRLARLGQSEDMAAAAARLLPVNTPLAMLLSLQAYERAPTVQAASVLIEAAQQPLDTMLASGEPIYSVAYSPDGHPLAAGVHNADVSVWDVAARRRIATFNAGSTVFSVAFSPDGRTLAVGTIDGDVRVWNVATRRRIATLDDRDPVEQLAFSSNGRLLATADVVGFVGLWNVATRHRLANFGEGNPVHSLAFSSDGRFLAASDFVGFVGLWDVTTRHRIGTLPEGSPVLSLTFSPDGRVLAVGDSDGDVGLWAVAAERKITTLSDGGLVSDVAFSPDGRTLAAGHENGDISLWDTKTGDRVAALNEGDPVSSVAFSRDGRTLAVGDMRGFVGLWNAAGAQRSTFANAGPVSSEAFSPDSRILAASGDDGDITLWDVQKGRQIGTLNNRYPVDSIAFNPDGGTLADGDGNGNITLWDVSKMRRIATLNNGSPISSIAFSRNGETLAVGDDGGISLWNVSSQHRTAPLNGGGPVSGVAFSMDGHTLAAIGDGYISLWEVVTRHGVATGRRIAILKEPGPVSSVAFSPDGQVLAVGGEGFITVWNLATRRRPTTLDNDNSVNNVAFSPDGRTLAAGDSGGFVGLWDVASKQQIASVAEDDGGADLTISPDGQNLAVGGSDGSIILLRLNTTELTQRYFRKLICDKVRHNMTRSQWSEFVPGLTYQRTC